MNESILSVAVVAVIGAIISVLIKQHKPEYSTVVSIAIGAVILVMLVPYIADTMDYIKNISDFDNQAAGYAKIVLKALGICIVTQFASDTCKDCGQSSIASKVELGGKICVLVISFPIFNALIETIQKLVNL